MPSAAPSTSRDPWVGTRVRGYLLTDLVARGALASVYRATQGDRSAAFKIYNCGHAGFAETRASIEVAAQGQVRHPAVARLLDAGRLPDGRDFLASEWIDGESLTLLPKQRPPWSKIRGIVSSIASGLGAIHDAGIVHRDVKPSNVMVPRSGPSAAVIVDFSHSLIMSNERVTETGVVLGSAAYMSPEQTQGLPLDGRSDLYALGVILYELLCGEPPFEGTAAELLRRHQREPVISPRKRAPDRNIPQGAEDLCMWLLAKDRDARIPNARVFAVTVAALAPSPLEVTP